MEDIRNMEGEQREAKKTIQELSNTIKRPNTGVMGVSESVEREARLKDVFNKIINENFFMEKGRGTNYRKHREPRKDLSRSGPCHDVSYPSSIWLSIKKRH